MVIAYGSAGAPSADLKVLPHLLGGESAIKWSHGSSPLAQAAAKVHGASAKSFLLPYSDASLFGVVVTAPTSEGVASVAKEVAGLVKGVKGSDEELKRAATKAKFAEASLLERHETLIATAGPAVSPTYSKTGVGIERITDAPDLLRKHPFARCGLCISRQSLGVIVRKGTLKGG